MLRFLDSILYSVKKGWRHSRLQPEYHLPNSPWAGKVSDIPVPAGISLTKLSLGRNNKLFPPRESLVSDIPASLVSDIPAEDGNVANLFLQCSVIIEKF